MTTWIIIILFSLILLIIIVLLIYGIILFNRIVQKENRVDESKASIEAMLKKRSDLIPKLVDSVKEYMGYEESTLKEVVELREETDKQENINKDRMKKEDRISHDIKQIQVKAEAYPDLKASENFKQLQGSLNEVEEQLSATRRFYNASVKDYHDQIQMFPNSLVASMKNFTEKEFFETSSEEKEDVDMKGLFK